jgi:predicted acetyltransferase
MLYLKAANYEDIEKEWLFQREIPSEENSFINEYSNISREDFNKALEIIIAQSEGLQLPDGYVPQTIYYLWDDDIIVGEFHIRHYLCESLVNGAGHIGYYIAPEYRKNGYATQGLRLALSIAENIVPEDEIYLRTDKYNTASLKVMLSNGGYIHHEDEIKYYVRIKKDNSEVQK